MISLKAKMSSLYYSGHLNSQRIRNTYFLIHPRGPCFHFPFLSCFHISKHRKTTTKKLHSSRLLPFVSTGFYLWQPGSSFVLSWCVCVCVRDFSHNFQCRAIHLWVFSGICVQVTFFHRGSLFCLLEATDVIALKHILGLRF